MHFVCQKENSEMVFLKNNSPLKYFGQPKSCYLPKIVIL